LPGSDDFELTKLTRDFFVAGDFTVTRYFKVEIKNKHNKIGVEGENEMDFGQRIKQ
jgi:hypothetical protein